jgi:putative phosphoserine phosphatase/1-acylglycerol-3-phosphate O-acyltransferase
VNRQLPLSLAEIEASPGGPEVGAFFDLDGTLVAGYTAMVFAEDRYRRRQVGVGEAIRATTLGAMHLAGRATFADLIALGAGAWKGLPLSELEELGQDLFEKRISERIYPEVRELVAAHHRRGHTVVLASSATVFQAQPAARALGIEHVLCSELETENGILTGVVREPMMWGAGKARAVERFAADHGVDLAQSWFYADGDEDEALMHLVGHPRPTNPGKRLGAVARRRGWPVLRFASRGGNGLVNVARNLTGLAATVPVGALATAAGVLNWNRRQAVDLTLTHATEVLLAISGVEVSAVGEEHLFSHRPAVFIWNHRNNFDPLVVAKLVRGGFTAVGKKELARDPIMGTAGRFFDMVYIDRSDTARAVETLRQVNELAQQGLSVLVAPEGTRSRTGELGPFKKGAFRIAMDTGLPIVPIVIRNADVLGPRNATFMRPGKVDVVVLPPIDVSGWTLPELEERIAEVRQRFVDTLDDWPGTYSA